MKELRECMRCGSEDVEFEYRDYDEENDVGDDGTGAAVCHNCGMSSPVEWIDTAVEWWNTRASDAIIKELVEALEFVVNQLSNGGLAACGCCKVAVRALEKYNQQADTP